MLFQLSQENFPDAIQTSAIPKEYASVALPHHIANVTIDNACTLIHQTVNERGYSLWMNNFFIHEPLLLHIPVEQQLYSLYYSIENIAQLLIQDEPKIIAPKEFYRLELPPGRHYGVFEKGTYRSLHIQVNEANRSILQDQNYAAALLREYYFDSPFHSH